MEPDKRDQVVDYVEYWTQRSGIERKELLKMIVLGRSRYYDWRRRYGKVNEHNGLVPRDHWLEVWEKETIVSYFEQHPLEGYRRLTYMMIDDDVVAASPSTVYRVLSGAGVLDRWNQKKSKKGTGFVQPLSVHKHWHVDISYLNIGGTFYYLCCLLDGYSRYLVHWDIKSAMKESDIELIIQQAAEKYPGVKPRIISDNGPQFIARDFKTFIRQVGMSHVRTSPYYPQSNGKIERFHKTIKGECIRESSFSNLDELKQVVAKYIAYYNNERLHSAIGYVTPAQKLDGKAQQIQQAREVKLARARELRKERRLSEALAKAS